MTIISSTETKFVNFVFAKSHIEKYFAQLEKRGNTFRSLVSAVGCFGPESYQFVGLLGLIEDVANNN